MHMVLLLQWSTTASEDRFPVAVLNVYRFRMSVMGFRTVGMAKMN